MGRKVKTKEAGQGSCPRFEQSIQTVGRWCTPIEIVSSEDLKSIRLKFPILIRSFYLELEIRSLLGNYWQSSWVDDTFIIIETRMINPQELEQLLRRKGVIME